MGKRWVQVEVRQRDGVVTWLMDGYIIATRSDNTGGYVSGNIMLGYMDPISGIADPANENYAIFDNVRVVRVAEEPTGPPSDLTIAPFDQDNLQVMFRAGGQASQYLLQSRTDLAPGVAWTDEAEAQIQNADDRFRVVVAKAGVMKFYRIRTAAQSTQSTQ